MVDHLIQFLARPRRRALSTQIVQDQQRHAAYQLEALVIGHCALRAEGRAEMVQQVGHDRKQYLLLAVQGLIPSGLRA